MLRGVNSRDPGSLLRFGPVPLAAAGCGYYQTASATQAEGLLMTTIAPHEALIYAMVTMSAVDRKMTDIELQRISSIVKTVPAFMAYDHDQLVKSAEACGNLLGDEEGLNDVLDIIADSLPHKLYETAYALAVEVAAADLKVPDEEIRLLELLRDALRLDKLVCAAIERSARARHQTL